MLVKDIMRENAVLCQLDTPVQKVVNLMLENECEFVTVVESYTHKNPIGIITEHDICLRTIAEGINPLKMSAGKVLNSKFEKISVTADAAECRHLFSNNKHPFLIVINENNSCCGFVLKEDLPSNVISPEFPSVLNVRTGFHQQISYADRIF